MTGWGWGGMEISSRLWEIAAHMLMLFDLSSVFGRKITMLDSHSQSSLYFFNLRSVRGEHLDTSLMPFRQDTHREKKLHFGYFFNKLCLTLLK